MDRINRSNFCIMYKFVGSNVPVTESPLCHGSRWHFISSFEKDSSEITNSNSGNNSVGFFCCIYGFDFRFTSTYRYDVHRNTVISIYIFNDWTKFNLNCIRLAYTIVSVCVLVLRYNDDAMVDEINITLPQFLRQLANINFNKRPSSLSSYITKIGIVVFSLLSIVICTLLGYADFTSVVTIALVAIVCASMLLVVVIIGRQPPSDDELSFKVPWVPVIPCLSVFINLYLMFQLDMHTWIRFLVWIVIGRQIKVLRVLHI